MEEKDLKSIKRIEDEITKIKNKENKIFFFVIDTQGNPSGSLEYIYKLALILKNDGYDVMMLYQLDSNEEFVGVREWLGNEYADIPHGDINNGEIGVSPCDILFIPEIFSNVMIQTKKLPCKRIMLLQNYDFMVEQMPISAQLGDLGIMECLTNTELNSSLIKDVFPYVRTNVVEPYIDNMYGTTDEPKKLIINILCKDQTNINKLIKPFYWKFPMYRWVSFRDLRGFPKEIYSKYLRESAITIWVDDDTSFGYGALEAMKSGSIVLAKTTNLTQKWMESENADTLSNCCVWFDTYHEAHRVIASVVRAWITDNVPSEIGEAVSNTMKLYSYDKTKKGILEYVGKVLDNRADEMEKLIIQIKGKQ